MRLATETRRRQRGLTLAIPLVVAGIVWGIAGHFLPNRPEAGGGDLGEHVGCQARVTAVGIQLWVGGGWKSAAWQEYRSYSGGGAWTETGHECFGFLLGYRRGEYNGLPSTIVRWGILGFPWWFFLALAI